MDKLNFEVYNRRWNKKDIYTITWQENGWHLKHIAHTGDCDKEGKPFLYGNFGQDSINYPSSIDGFMEHLWQEIDEEVIDHEEAQKKLQQLADWVTTCEKATPKWEGWN